MTIHNQPAQTKVFVAQDDDGTRCYTTVKVEILKTVILLAAVAVMCFACYMLGATLHQSNYVYLPPAEEITQQWEVECSSKRNDWECTSTPHCGFCRDEFSGICTTGDGFGPYSESICCTEWIYKTKLEAEECTNFRQK